MNGEPIPGEHWVEIDLQGVYSVDRLVIDWEVAYSNDWTVQVIYWHMDGHSGVVAAGHV
jgi:hypothetical protein